MKIKLIEDPRVRPACRAQLDDFSSSHRYNYCEIKRYRGTDETVHADEQVRLLLSGDAERDRDQRSRGQSMVSSAGSLRKERPVEATVSSLDTKLSPTARRASHKPCPDCGSMTVRSTDGRDMCIICGYLQTHA